jgi:hypothetical protein
MLHPNYPLRKVVHVSTRFNMYLIQIKNRKEEGKAHIESHGQSRTQPRYQMEFQTSFP